MEISDIVYYVFLSITIAALGVLIFTNHIIHAAFSFFAVLLGIAALYVFWNAELPAVAHLLIYVGGILVLLIFGVMLTKNYTQVDNKPFFYRNYGIIILFTVIVCLLYSTLYFLPIGADTNTIMAKTEKNLLLNSIEHIGFLFVTEYLLAFEAIGWLLLVALAGASTIISTQKATK